MAMERPMTQQILVFSSRTGECFECVRPDTDWQASRRALGITGLYSSNLSIILYQQDESTNRPSQNVYADVASRWDCQDYYGIDLWFAGHRFGASGLADPNTADINSIFIPIPMINAAMQEV